MDIINLYERKNYTRGDKYIFNKYIREYDISKANINILLYIGIITRGEYDRIASLSRMDRQIHIGYILKDEKINAAFEEALISIRKKFITENHLTEEDILSIKNDAIYVIGDKPIAHTSFANIKFLCKNIYTSYMKIFNLEIYYYLDKVNDKESIDIKGINDSKLDDHKEYMIDLICNVLYNINCGYRDLAMSYMHNMYMKYCNKDLDIGYYRTFDSMSNFIISINNYRYGLNSLHSSKENYDILDISYNANVMREIFACIVNYIN